MKNLVKLRAMRPDDVEPLFVWENDPQVRVFSGEEVVGEYSREDLQGFIEESRGTDLVSCGQQRFMIDYQGVTVGCVDLYEFDEAERAAGIGILIYADEMRGKGVGAEVLRQLAEYARGVYQMRCLWALVPRDNCPAVGLFVKEGFAFAGGYDPKLYSKML